MTKKEYIKSIGFNENPFEYTNADKEVDILDKYFIQPDYFEDVWGDPENPVSNIVYAPRGGGKTAQRLMIEKRAEKHDEILTITYADHDLTNFKSAEDITLSYHLEYLNRLFLLAFFDRISKMNDFTFIHVFNRRERQFIFNLCRIYLYDTPASFPRQAVNSLKMPEDHLSDVWSKFKAPISELIKVISRSKGAEVDISTIELDQKLKLTHKDNLLNIKYFLEKIGITTIYILIDKVDEQSLTGNDPKASYYLVSELIKDLELLELPGIGFKFFLWDALKPFCNRDARPDRVFSYNLRWDFRQIGEMMDLRLKAYSSSRVSIAKNLFDDFRGLGRVILFSEFSPRDCIRIANRILSEQYKDDENHRTFKQYVVNSSIDSFCKEKVNEFLQNERNVRYLSRVNHVSFTIEELVVGKLAADAPAVRNIIQPWSSSNLLNKIGLVHRKGKKAVNEYAFQDIRLARFACPTINLNDFVTLKIRRCKSETCETISYRDFERKEYSCIDCNATLD